MILYILNLCHIDRLRLSSCILPLNLAVTTLHITVKMHSL